MAFCQIRPSTAAAVAIMVKTKMKATWGQACDAGVKSRSWVTANLTCEIAESQAMLEIVLPEKADAVIGFRADPELQARIEELAQKSTEGDLTEDERAEYAGYVRANKFVAILKRQAQQIANSRV